MKMGLSERGYTTTTLIVMMTLFSLAMLAVAPSIQQEVQRQKELEAIRRGEEVAEAIREYINFYQGTRLPSSIEDLLEGLPQGTKRRQILRPSAAIDPLSEDGKWLLVGPESPVLRKFARRVQNHMGGALPSSENVHPNILNQVGVFITSTDTEPDESEDSSEDTDLGYSELRTDSSPFVGVVSQSRAKSVIAYYGIENHSKWIFTPLFRGSNATTINFNQKKIPENDSLTVPIER
jgi:type II secretory pathway pseudopilin PulG